MTNYFREFNRYASYSLVYPHQVPFWVVAYASNLELEVYPLVDLLRAYDSPRGEAYAMTVRLTATLVSASVSGVPGGLY